MKSLFLVCLDDPDPEVFLIEAGFDDEAEAEKCAKYLTTPRRKYGVSKGNIPLPEDFIEYRKHYDEKGHKRHGVDE